MTMRDRLFLLFIAALACLPSLAEAPLGTSAQALLEEAAKAKKVAGMSAAIWKDGAIAWEGAVGFADVENQVPATPAMVHRIASISKPISAVAAMQLVEQGKLKLDEPIQTYVPTFPKKPEGDILIWHLLSHTSGIRHYKGSESVAMDYFADSLSAMKGFQDDAIGFAPGTKYNYTTYGYTVLGAAIEAASASKLGDYLQKNVWTPAGMTSTRLELHGVIVPHRSRGYALNPKGELENARYTDNSVRYAGGGMISTAGDLVRFAAAVQDGTLLKRETFERMIQPVTLADGTVSRYALGWTVDTWDVLGRIMSHSGGQSGTSTHLLSSLDRGVSVALISNTRGDTGLNEVGVLLANIALGTTPPPDLKIDPEKTLSDRMKEEQQKKAGRKP
ncbi:MAG TPA: serine hydrolase domain-containing protein [Candidatus Hydrogenedentes bacterium]|nr:serine hydrolase domain-containing protein [Candidatus Hydrogenedentota bacterium]